MNNGHQAMIRAEELDRTFREQGGDPRFITADGKSIDDGDWFWNYDLRLVRVSFAETRFGQHWDGWFTMRTLDDERGAVMNACRLCVTHPATLQNAREAAMAERGKQRL